MSRPTSQSKPRAEGGSFVPRVVAVAGLAAAAAVAVVACSSSATTGDAQPGDAKPARDGGPLDAPGTLPVSGTVYLRPCVPLNQATVGLVGATTTATTDRDGRFALTGVPTSAVFRVTASGYAETRSSRRTIAAATDQLELAAARSDYLVLLYLAAGVAQDPTKGTVIMGLTNRDALPVAGVTAELDGGGGIAKYLRYQPGTAMVSFSATDLATVDSVGVVVVFNVAPGEYTFRAKRSGYVFPDVAVVVSPGVVVSDHIMGTGSGGTVPIVVNGVVKAAAWTGAAWNEGVLADAKVTLAGGPAGDLETTTNASGAYHFDLDFAHRRGLDLTVRAGSRVPVRSSELCIEAPFRNEWNVTLGEEHVVKNWWLKSLGSRPFDVSTGHVWASVEQFSLLSQQWTGVVGAQLTTSPAADLFYQEDPAGVQTCATQACTLPGNACPTGTRCSDGECLLGSSGSACDHCSAGNTCPSGYTATTLPATAGAPRCYCLLTEASCLSPSPPCPSGTWCRVDYDSGWKPTWQGCWPYAPRLKATTVDANGRSLYVMIPSLIEGSYTVYGDHPTLSLAPSRVRVSAGVLTYAWVQAR